MKNNKYSHRGILLFLCNPELFFVLIASIFGIAFLVVVPPFQTPDENIHFYRAYEVSELRTPQSINGGEPGSYLPLSIRQTEERVHGAYAPPNTPGHIMFNTGEKYSYRFTKSALFDIPLNQNNRIFYITSASPAYMPILYAPQALTVGIARLFGTPIIVMLYMVRVVNLSLWIFLVYLAIKIFPWKKWALVGICLLPVVVSQSISPGLDVGTIGSSLIFLAITLKAISNDKHNLSRKRIVILLATATVMVFGKSVLAVFLPLVFLIKKRQFEVPLPIIIKIVAVILPVALYVIWALISQGYASNTDQLSGSTQINSLIHNPWLFAGSMINTFFFITPSGDILSDSIIGSFGWLDTPLSPPFVIFGYIALSLILLVNYDPPIRVKEITSKTRIVLLVTGLLYVGAVFLAMYVFFTPATGNHVRGVNGRYLIPLMFLLIPVLFSNILRVRKQIYTSFIKVSTILLLVASVLTITFRYYASFVPQ